MLNRKTVSVDQLLKASKSELAELFALCPVPEIDELDGPMDGRVINGNYIWNTRLGLSLTNALWKGKTFSAKNNVGWNRVSLGLINLEIVKYKMSIEDSMEYRGKVYKLRYKYRFSLNLWPLRMIVDEMRKVREGLYLGTGNVKLPGRHRLFDWYILECN